MLSLLLQLAVFSKIKKQVLWRTFLSHRDPKYSWSVVCYTLWTYILHLHRPFPAFFSPNTNISYSSSNTFIMLLIFRDWVIAVTDAGQATHFHMVRKQHTICFTILFSWWVCICVTNVITITSQSICWRWTVDTHRDITALQYSVLSNIHIPRYTYVRTHRYLTQPVRLVGWKIRD